MFDCSVFVQIAVLEERKKVQEDKPENEARESEMNLFNNLSDEKKSGTVVKNETQVIHYISTSTFFVCHLVIVLLILELSACFASSSTDKHRCKNFASEI